MFLKKDFGEEIQGKETSAVKRKAFFTAAREPAVLPGRATEAPVLPATLIQPEVPATHD